jgi:hypothetical protein
MKFSPDHQSHSAFASLVAAIMGGAVTGWRELWPLAADHHAHSAFAAAVAAVTSGIAEGWHRVWPPILTGFLTYLGTRIGSVLWGRRPPWVFPARRGFGPSTWKCLVFGSGVSGSGCE